MGRCKICGKRISFLHWGSGGLCLGCLGKEEDKKKQAAYEQEKESGNAAYCSLVDTVRQLYPGRTPEAVVGVEWTYKSPFGSGLVGDMVKAALSGGLGMSGPWLMAVGKNADVDCGFLCLFEEGETVFYAANGKNVPRSGAKVNICYETSLGEDKPRVLKIVSGFDNFGAVSISPGLGSKNVEAAARLVHALTGSPSPFVAKRVSQQCGWCEKLVVGGAIEPDKTHVIGLGYPIGLRCNSCGSVADVNSVADKNCGKKSGLAKPLISKPSACSKCGTSGAQSWYIYELRPLEESGFIIEDAQTRS